MITKVKGTQDFLNLSLYNFVIDQTKKHLNEYNFTEIKIPILEYTELFQRTLGTQTDIINKEMFIIQPKGVEKESICLRPEATAAIARAFIENNIDQLPWKVFTHGPMFRYERPQKGRFREFNQVSIEIIGTKSIYQDAYLIKILDELFKSKFLLENYAILINFLGCYDDRKKFAEILKSFLNQSTNKICSTCLERKDKNPLRVFDCKNEQCKEFYKKAPTTLDNLCEDCNNEWKELQTILELTSISFLPSPTLVRGLDYYDKTVFEFVSADLGAQNTFCGGGRYDSLIKEISNNEKDQFAIGAAFGIERILILLESKKEILSLTENQALYVIIPIDYMQNMNALLLAEQLHANKISCDIILENNSIKSAMRKANKMGAKFVLIIGQDENEKQEVTLKNMQTGIEQRIKQAKVIEHIKKIFN